MSKRILVVDDDVDYLAGMKMQLEAAGYDVTTAESVAEAERSFGENRPACAIVDLMMDDPDDGFTLCYHMKKKDQNVPVIMVTAVTSETGMEFSPTTDGERSWIKADAMLAKPLRFEQLKQELDRLVGE